MADMPHYKKVPITKDYKASANEVTEVSVNLKVESSCEQDDDINEIGLMSEIMNNTSDNDMNNYAVTQVLNSNSDEEPLIRYTDDQDGSSFTPGTDLDTKPITKAYKRRFWIVSIISILTWFCCVQWNAWGPISESMFAAFPDWSPSTVAMMETWVTFMFVCCVLPVCWLVKRIGLRSGILFSSLLFTLGLALRCITDKSPVFTIMCHVCSILLGISMTLILSSPPMIASVWFPPNERTSAVAFMLAMANLGMVGSYLEPLVVKDPSNHVSTAAIKTDIMRLMYIVAGVAGALFLAILAYFPSRPPLPPSFTSTTDRLDFKESLISIFRNKSLVIFILIYGVASGPSLGWIGMLNFSLKPLGFNQGDAMYVGLVSVLLCFVVTLGTGWLTDRLYGYLKETIIVLLLAATAFYYWFLLLSTEAIPFSRWQVYVSVALGLSLNFASLPLFFEMSVEIAYPIPEVLVGGVVTASDSLCTSVFLSMYFFKSVDFCWVSYTLVASTAISVFALLFVNETYSRNNLDYPNPDPVKI